MTSQVRAATPCSEAPLDRRPGEIFRERCLVAPFPEGERGSRRGGGRHRSARVRLRLSTRRGLHEPSVYLAQLGNLSEDQVHGVMRRNMGRFLGVPG